MYPKGQRPIIAVCASVQNLPENTALLGLMDVLKKLKDVEQAWENGVDTVSLYTLENGFSWNGRYLVTLDYFLFSPQYLQNTDAVIYRNIDGYYISLRDLLEGELADFFPRQYRKGHSFPKLAASNEFELTEEQLNELRGGNKWQGKFLGKQK